MRVLVINWQDRKNPHSGGAELHLHEVFGRLASRGHTVHLLCSGFEGAGPVDKMDGMDVFRVGSRYTFQFMAKRGYRKLLEANRYDILVEDLNKVPLFTPLWKASARLTLVHHLFGSTAFREASFPMAALVWLSEQPIARVYRNTPFQSVSKSTAADLVARGVPEGNIRVIYNGVDTATLTPDSSERSPHPLFSYLGRLKKYKRVDIVIRAFGLIDAPGARLEIAGAGDHRADLEALTASLGLGERVRFLGRISESEKLSLLRRSWATVLASPKEGWGITNLESAACGTAVIAVNSPGIRESVLDGKTGYLVNSSAPSALAERMNEMINNPQQAAVLGAGAREFAERFTWDRAADETERDLEAIIHGRPR